MNDSTFQQESWDQPRMDSDAVPDEEQPRFGAVDIVEAFTAMRHEWRGQIKESRALAEQIQSVAANLLIVESKLLARGSENPPADSTETIRLVQVIIELDHQFSRAVTSIAQWEANQKLRDTADANAVEQCVAGMTWIARRFARPLLMFLAEQRSAHEPAANHSAVEGLNMVLGRLRRMMHEQGIERIEVQGQPFDENTMHAIGTIATVDCHPGHVAEQLSPAYRWHGRLIRFAEVRVARSSGSST